MTDTAVQIVSGTHARSTAEDRVVLAASPFRGILPFRYADRDTFFGREREINDLSAKIVLYRLVVLFGESGSGKSSLLNAGVIPRLMAEGFSVDRLSIRPFDAEPLLVDRSAVGDPVGGYVPSIFGPPELDSKGAVRNVGTSLEKLEERLAASDQGRTSVLVFDQFEELFTLFDQEQRAIQERILELIYRLIEGGRGGDGRTVVAKVVIGIREDFLGKLEVLSRRYPQILDRRVRLGLLSAKGARQAILRPFGFDPPAEDQLDTRDANAERRFKSEMTPELATAIVKAFGADTTDVAINPTHLQIVCSQIWERFSIDAKRADEPPSVATQRVAEIRPEHFASLGSIEGIWKGFLGSELDKMPSETRAAASRLLGELVTEAGTRDVVSRQRLAERVKSTTTVSAFLSGLAELEERRLINQTPQDETFYYEIASEFLVAPIRQHNVKRESEAAVRKTMITGAYFGAALILLFVAILFLSQFFSERRRSAESRNRLSEVMVGIASSRESSGRAGEALAYLARALELNPDNHAARSAILNQLVYRSWPVSKAVIPHRYPVRFAEFSPDGRRMVTIAGDSEVRIFSLPDGKSAGASLAHGGAIVSLSHFDPTGTRLLTVANDGIARLWDVEAGTTLRSFRHGQGQQTVKVTVAIFSPDGDRIATGADDGSVQIWRAADGAKVAPVISTSGNVDSLRFSHNGSRLLITLGNRIRVVDASSGRSGFLLTHDGIVYDVQFSADDQRILTASGDGFARIWNVRTGMEALRVVHEKTVLSAQFGPGDATIVTASEDGTARVWDSVTGRQLRSPMRHNGPVVSASFSPEGDRIITASKDLSARVWSAEGDDLVVEPMWHAAAVNFARFSPDGQLAVTTSDDRSARVWDVRAGAALPLTLHADDVMAAQFAPDGKRIVTATKAGQAFVWDTTRWEAQPQSIDMGGQGTWSEFSRDGSAILTVAGQEARTWDATTLQQQGAPLRHEYGLIRSARFSADGRQVVTASTDRTAVVWESSSGRKITTLTGHTEALWFADFDHDGRRVVTAATDFTARLWDAASGKSLQEFHHEGAVFVARFSPDGRRILTASADRTARIWNAEDGKLLHTMSHGDNVVQARFSPDGRRIVTASQDRAARLWDAETGEPIGPAMVHNAEVDAVSFSPDGTRLVTGSRDGIVRVWDVRTSTAIGPPLRQNGSVSTLQFDPSGGAIACASADGHVRVWVLPVGETSDAVFLSNAAERVGGFRLNDRDAALAIREDTALTRQDGKVDLPAQSSMLVGRIARWFVADRASRTISPFSAVTVGEFIARLLQDPNPFAAHREAVLALPGDTRIPRLAVTTIAWPDAGRRPNH